jgi:hypothetical protein
VDPITALVVAGAVGGASGKLAEKAWDRTELWVGDLYHNHLPKALQKGRANAASFLLKFAVQAKLIEDSGQVPEEKIESALEGPEFAVSFQQAMLAASQTECEERHDLLARLLAERLAADPEGLLAVVSKRAVDTISCLSLTHLKILGLMASVQVVQPDPELLEGIPREEAKARLLEYLATIWERYRDIECSPMDFLHLLTESCIVDNSRVIGSLATHVNENLGIDYFTDPELERNSGTAHVYQLWRAERSLRLQLTTTGRLIGVYVGDLLSGTKTDLSGFE